MNEKNILLLSMSLISRVEECYYHGSYENNSGECNVKEEYFRGLSQLEPGTKFFLRNLQDQKKKIDKIFIVESPESAAKEGDSSVDVNLLSPYFFGPTHFIRENDNTTSSVDVYKDRICQYIEGDERTCTDHPKNAAEKMKLAEDVDRYDQDNTLREMYPEPKRLFEDVCYNDLDIYNCIYDLCDRIRKEADDTSRVVLWVDMQGARRYETFILNAAVKLLEMADIRVAQSIAIDYFPKHNENGKFNDIVDTTINDRVFEMVSGMNEFIRTGRGDTLREFWENTKSLPGFSLEKEKYIIQAICKISDAISICSIGEFDKGLNSFKKALEKYSLTDDGKNPLFRVYVTDLAQDYNKYNLLNDSASGTLDQIKWCYDKKLFQQALTLIEAKIPHYLIDNGILYYGDGTALKKLFNVYDEFGLGKNIGPGYIRKGGNFENIKFAMIKYVLKYDEKDDSFCLFLQKKNKKGEKTGKTFTIPALKNTHEDREITDRVKKIFQTYNTICKDYRNDINHASGEAITPEAVRNKIREFISECDTLSKSDYIDLYGMFPIDYVRGYILRWKSLNILGVIPETPGFLVKSKILYYGSNDQLITLLNNVKKIEGIDAPEIKDAYRWEEHDAGRTVIQSDKANLFFLKYVIKTESKNDMDFSFNWADVLKENNVVREITPDWGQTKQKVRNLMRFYDDLKELRDKIRGQKPENFDFTGICGEIDELCTQYGVADTGNIPDKVAALTDRFKKDRKELENKGIDMNQKYRLIQKSE